MDIAERPGSTQHAEVNADRFDSGAGLQQAEPEPTSGKERRVATMVRFDADLLRRIDATAKRRGISRSAWISITLSQAIDPD